MVRRVELAVVHGAKGLKKEQESKTGLHVGKGILEKLGKAAAAPFKVLRCFKGTPLVLAVVHSVVW